MSIGNLGFQMYIDRSTKEKKEKGLSLSGCDFEIVKICKESTTMIFVNNCKSNVNGVAHSKWYISYMIPCYTILSIANSWKKVVQNMSEFRYKQVIVFRTDLKLSKGKAAVQAGHAAVSGAEEARKHFKKWWQAWISEGQRKIAVKVKNEDELGALRTEAEELALPHALIIDRGLTEIPPNTVTCLAIGPAPSETIDKITGTLPLL